jgi:hypothetical protein
VSDTDDIIGLIEVAGFHMRHDGNDRRGIVASNEDGQTVRQDLAFDRSRVE